MKFYRCKHCGQIIAIVKETKVPIMCCGEKTTDAAVEKHVPVLSVEGNKAIVTVGSVAHPMLEEHYIEWIAIETAKGNQRVILKAGDEPKAEFALLDGDEVLAVYAYCNLHSLWKA